MIGSPFWSDVRSSHRSKDRRSLICFFCRNRYLPSRLFPVFTFPFVSRNDRSLIVCLGCHNLTLEGKTE